jgi:hypothetical protein
MKGATPKKDTLDRTEFKFSTIIRVSMGPTGAPKNLEKSCSLGFHPEDAQQEISSQ